MKYQKWKLEEKVLKAIARFDDEPEEDA